jgi:hypothetical protein
MRMPVLREGIFIVIFLSFLFVKKIWKAIKAGDRQKNNQQLWIKQKAENICKPSYRKITNKKFIQCDSPLIVAFIQRYPISCALN